LPVPRFCCAPGAGHELTGLHPALAARWHSAAILEADQPVLSQLTCQRQQQLVDMRGRWLIRRHCVSR